MLLPVLLGFLVIGAAVMASGASAKKHRLGGLAPIVARPPAPFCVLKDKQGRPVPRMAMVARDKPEAARWRDSGGTGAVYILDGFCPLPDGAEAFANPSATFAPSLAMFRVAAPMGAGFPVDQYGRSYTGPGQWIQFQTTLRQLTDSPLYDVATAAAIMVPGIGIPLSTGMAALKYAAEAESFQDAAFNATLLALPEPQRTAAEIGYGAMRGEGMSTNQLQALQGWVDEDFGPEAANAFAQGVQLARMARP